MSLRFALLSAAFAAALLGLSPAGAISAEHTVKMLNDNGKGEFMVFEPSFVQAAPGDTIKFVATDQFHNAETLPEIWPEGADLPGRGEQGRDAHRREGGRLRRQVPAALPDGHDGARGRRQVGQSGPGQGLSPPEFGKKRFEPFAAQVPQKVLLHSHQVVMPAQAGTQ